MEQTTDAELVVKTLEDSKFLGDIINRYEGKLSRYVMRLGINNIDDREDVLQEIFIKVYRYLYSYDENMPFSSWVYRIAHNEAISWYRKKNVRPEGHLVNGGDDILKLTKSSDDSKEQLLDKLYEKKILEVALQKIESKYRDILILRFFEQKSYDEISDILKLPTGSVGTHIYRGKRQLKKLLEDEDINI